MRLFVRLQDGGAGFTSAVQNSLPSYTASYASFMANAPKTGEWKRVAELAADKQNTDHALFEAMSQLLEAAHQPALGQPQHRNLSKALAKHCAQAINKKLFNSDPVLIPQLLQPTAYSAFLALPFSEVTRFDAREAVFAWRRRLGIPTDDVVAHAQNCVCGKLFTEDHALGCPNGGRLIKRHNITNGIAYGLVVSTGHLACYEKTGELFGMQRADIIAYPTTFGTPIIAKTTIFDTTITKNSAERAEHCKLNKPGYKESCEHLNRDFVPLAFNINGSCTDDTRAMLDKFIGRLAADPTRFSPRPGAVTPAHYYHQLLSCAIHKGTAHHALWLAHASVEKAGMCSRQQQQ
jgi:hypothetical protein